MLISEKFCNLSTGTHVLGVAGWAPESVSLLSDVPQWGWGGSGSALQIAGDGLERHCSG